MIEVLMNYTAEIVVSILSTAALTLWGYLALAFKRNDAKLNEFLSIPKNLQEANSKLESTQQRMVSISATLTDLHLEIKARGDLNIDVAEFTCASEGNVTYVNQTLARWLGVGKQELLGWGWVNYVHVDDRDRVRREWMACVKEHRTLSIHYRLVEADGDITNVHAVATPIPDAPPARQWVGVIRKERK